jgi:predicted membrane protein
MSRYDRYYHGRNRRFNKQSRPIIGIVLLLAGALLVARAMGVWIPDFLLSWQMILIAVGLSIGIGSRFKNIGFIFPLAVGSIFLFKEYYPDFFPENFLLPAILIFAGIVLIFKPANRYSRWRGFPYSVDEEKINEPATEATEKEKPADFSTNTNTWRSDDRLQETAVFGNIRKTLITKNFVGGEVSSVFGSAEVNLLQADMVQEARLELNAVFGSIKLIVPAHWQVKMETTAVLGGIDDKRSKHAIYSDKVLRLEGNAVFGGIQIESH